MNIRYHVYRLSWSHGGFTLHRSPDVDYADLVLARTSSEWKFDAPFVEFGAGLGFRRVMCPVHRGGGESPTWIVGNRLFS
jgi:hypothetical protein